MLWKKLQNNIIGKESVNLFALSFCCKRKNYTKRDRPQWYYVDYDVTVTANGKTHPSWSQEKYGDYSQYEGFHAMKMYNGSCL